MSTSSTKTMVCKYHFHEKETELLREMADSRPGTVSTKRPWNILLYKETRKQESYQRYWSGIKRTATNQRWDNLNIEKDNIYKELKQNIFKSMSS